VQLLERLEENVRMTRVLLTTGERFVRLAERRGSWEQSVALEGSGAQCLAADPSEPERVFVGSRGSGLLASGDGGRTWRDAGLPERDVFSVAVSSADGAVYAGTEPSRLFRSDDHGESWTELTALQRIPSRPDWSFPPRPWTSHVRWIAPHPRRPERLLVGIELGGLMYSDDRGETFEDHRPGAQRDVHGLVWHPRAPGRAYEAAGGGAAWTADGGRTWEPADAGRDRHYCWAVAPDPEDPDRWYVSAAPGPREAHGGGRAGAHLYRWEGKGPWRRLEGGLPQPLESLPYALVATAAGIFAGLGDGRILRSQDRGETWSSQPAEVEAITALVVGA
jgi:hypothetical protein